MKKRGIGLSYLAWVIVALVTFFIVVAGFIILRRAGSGGIAEILKTIF